MFSTTAAVICAFVAVVAWTSIGLPVALRFAPGFVAVALAPIIGWAIENIVALPVMSFIGLSRGTVLTVFVVTAAATWALSRRRAPLPASASRADVALVLCVAAVAAVAMWTVVPKGDADSVILSSAIFDHAKVAMIDEMAQSGVPAINPYVADAAMSGHLAYYYLWHFAAAQMAVLFGLRGWEADAGLTFFTAAASLAVMMGVAVRISGRSRAAWWTLPVALAGSLRPFLDAVFGSPSVAAVAGTQSGLLGWLFQVSWAPQHVAAAACAVAACVVLADLARRPTFGAAAVLGLLAAATFQSSTWIGALAFPLAAVLAGAVLLASLTADRLRFAVCALGAGAVTVAFCLPFLLDQMKMTALRGDTWPVALSPYPALGGAVGEGLRRLLDPFAFWAVTLPLEFSAEAVGGLAALAVLLWRRRAGDGDARDLRVFAVQMLVAIAIAGLLKSTIAPNNDLAWRSILPGVLLLTAFAGAGLAMTTTAWRLALCALVAASFVDTRDIVAGSISPAATKGGAEFARAGAMWAAVRELSRPDERVANNPDNLGAMTPWSINIGWALQAARRSCYAGPEVVLPFSSFTKERRAEADALFVRVFAGTANDADIAALVATFDCALIVVTPGDGLWASDSLTRSGRYTLTLSTPEWNIFRAIR